MALLGRAKIIAALTRLGEIAHDEGYTINLAIAGGAALVLGYNARQSTQDLDAIFLSPSETKVIRNWAKTVASEFNWAEDWLNDGVKGYAIGISNGPILLNTTGIIVRQLAVEQLLAMKLCAWRDDVDIQDASLLLNNVKQQYTRDEIWQIVLPYLVKGRE